MNTVSFGNCLILNSRFGTSKAGNPYCALSFVDMDTMDVYDVMQFGDSASVAAGLSKGANCGLSFAVEPSRNGGVRLNIISVER